MAEVVYKVEEATPQKKSVSLALIVFLAVLVAIAGGTLAYLTTTTDTASNMFTAGDIDAELTEENWVPENAEFMLPGVTVAKDPLITNTTTAEVDEWTGMIVKFQKPATLDGSGGVATWTNMSDEEVATFLLGVRIQSGTDAITAGGFVPQTNWGERIDTTSNVTAVTPGQWVYAYNAVIAAGGLGGHFQIEVQGAAVQGDIEQDEAVKAILTLFGYTPVATP